MDERENGVAAWTDETDDFDRVVAIATTLSQPRTAAHIADEALVEEDEAREHLDQLVDLGVLQQFGDEEGAMYSPDPLHTRMQTLRDLLNECDREELRGLRDDLQSRLEGMDGRERDLTEHRLEIVEEAEQVQDRYTFGKC